MATKAGVWIDHKRAVIVLIGDAETEIKKIDFDIGQPIHKKGGGRSKNTYTRNDFVAENRLARKVDSDRKDYYGDVLAALRGVSSVLILGPGEAKGELGKLILAKKSRGLDVASEAADKLTDRQLKAKVGEYFAARIAGKAKTTTVGKSKKAVVGNAATRKKTVATASKRKSKEKS